MIAVLRGLLTLTASFLPRQRKPLIGFFVLAVSLLGFQDIVGAAYPALGWAYLILLMIPSKEMKKENRVHSA